VATTSSGRSRRPSLWFSCAAVLAAAALLNADPDDGSKAELRLRPTSAFEPATPDAIAPARAPPLPRAQSISADAIERSLLAVDAGTRDLVLQRMLTAWTPDDPQAAARFAELQTDSFLREVALRTVAQVWTQHDPGSASLWAGSLADEAERARVIEAVALAMGNSDARAALELLAGQGTDTRTHTTRVGVIASWASRDFAAAQSWIEAQPPSPARDEIVLRLAFLRAQTDPPAATLLSSQMISDESARHRAYASIIRPWFARDPDGARRWATYMDAETRRVVEAELAIAETDFSPD
jgi:hypothetical protein